MSISSIAHHLKAKVQVQIGVQGDAGPHEVFESSAPDGTEMPGALRRLANSAMATAGKDHPEITYAKTLEKIASYEPRLHDMSDAELQGQTQKFRAMLKPKEGMSDDQVRKFQQETMQDILPEAFATVREGARRSTGMRPFDVQMLGGIAMFNGDIAEMGTGEGKTLAAVMPTYLNALAGRGAHVITVNETLAQRDAVNMGRIYHGLGLTVGTALREKSPDQNRDAYNCDVTYLTDDQEGFDYLRDNMSRDNDPVQRKPYAVILDEVDEILLDKARTKLIISGPGTDSGDDYHWFSQVMKTMVKGRDYEEDEESHSTVSPTEAGYDRIRQMSGLLKGLEPGTDFVIDDKHNVGLTTHGLANVQDRLGSDRLQDGQGYKTGENGLASLTASGMKTVDRKLGVDMYAPVDYDKLLTNVQKAQKDGHVVNVQFGTLDEAFEFKNRLKAAGLKYAEGRPETRLRQEKDVVGVLYPEAKNASPGHGPRVTPVTMDAYADSPRSLISYADACLRAEGKLERDKDYVVTERPQWAAMRKVMTGLAQVANPTPLQAGQLADLQRRHTLDLYAATLPMAADGPLMQEAGEKATAATNAFLSGDPEAAKTVSGQMLATYIAHLPADQRVVGQPITIPGPVIDAVREEQRVDLLQSSFSKLPAETQKSLIERGHQVMGTDPLGAVQLVDEYTGVITPDRRLKDGVHQALEAKEGVRVQQDSQTMAEISLRNLFQRFEHVGAMSGTVKTDEKEFQELCGMSVVEIPPNKPSHRVDLPDAVFETKAEKETWLADQVEAAYRRGQPVLVGTPDIELNREIGGIIADRHIPFNLLNAQDVRENTPEQNALIAQAGRSGAVTVATDMAGRGVDIRPDLVSYKAMAEKAAEVSRTGRAVGIPVDDVDEASKVFRWLAGAKVPITVAEAGQVKPEELQAGHVTLIYPQASNFPSLPPGVPLLPAVVPQPSSEPALMLAKNDFPSGGLLVLGAERHDARRIDNQLIGRSGRQGEPGTTQFAISLEDEIIANFADGKLGKWLAHQATETADDTASKVVAHAQQRVQDQYYSGRLNDAKYESSFNIQRDVVYDDRREIVAGTDLKPRVVAWADDKIGAMAEPFKKHWDGDAAVSLSDTIHEAFGLPQGEDPDKADFKTTVARLQDEVHARYTAREKEVGGADAMKKATTNWFLDALDDEWHYHLDDMSALQEGIGFRSMAQIDPVVAFKTEAGRTFEDMKHNVEDRTLESVFGGHITPTAIATEGTSKTPQTPVSLSSHTSSTRRYRTVMGIQSLLLGHEMAPGQRNSELIPCRIPIVVTGSAALESGIRGAPLDTR
ncbi:MAG TPA: hypothetical protein VGO93_28140 [Candidatus Xenobia bacterium]